MKSTQNILGQTKRHGLMLGKALLLALPMCLTSCEDILGQWDKPTPATPATPAKTAGTISFATTSLTKGNLDPAFTNELTKTGDGTVSYTSSNTSVATVDANGQVTPVGTGTATITASISDSGTFAYETKSVSYTVEVKDGCSYLEWSGTDQEVKIAPTADCVEVTAGTTALDEGSKLYIVKGNVTILGNVSLNASPGILLCDGATLTINGQVQASGANDLHILAQSDGDKMGILNVTYAGDVMTLGSLFVHGGKINVTATGASAAGGIKVTNFIMPGGDVKVCGAGGGTGLSMVSGSIMNDAKLEAIGGDNAAGSGGTGLSVPYTDPYFEVSGNACLTATGGNATGGDNNGGIGIDGKLVVKGGKAKVTGGNASGSGQGGHGIVKNSVCIDYYGGSVMAMGGNGFTDGYAVSVGGTGLGFIQNSSGADQSMRQFNGSSWLPSDLSASGITNTGTKGIAIPLEW